MLGILGEIGPFRACLQPRDKRSLDPDGVRDRLESRRRPAIDVDPEELAIAEPLGHVGAQVDLAVLPIGVVQPDGVWRDPLVAGRAGRRDQWIAARRTATTMASKAVAYWRMSMERSTRSPVGGSIALGCGIREAGW